MNKLYNDTAVQAIANAIRAKNGSSNTYTIAEMSTALNDISYYAKPTISNVALATFEADGLPLNSLKVSVEAKQEGSGTPSPENVRPISGWSEVVVSDVDDVDNPTVTQTTTISLGQTVYGGEVDVVNGTSGNKLTHGFVEYDGSDDEIWQIAPQDSTAKIIGSAPGSKTGTTSVISNYFESPSTNPWSVDNTIWTRYSQLHVNPDSSIIPSGITQEGLAEWKTWLSTHPLQVCYELATPTTFTTQPTPIKSLNGINNLSVDCGDVIELEYFKEV